MRGFRGWHLGCALALLLLAAGAGRADPVRLLRAAEEADKRLNYTGIRTVRDMGRGERAAQRVRVWHLAPDKTRLQYLDSKGGNLLLECGTRRWFYSGRRGRWRSIEWRSSRSSLELLLRNYRVRRLGSGTVAGRRVVELVIEPRHEGNPTKRVWIDPTCRMALREEVRDGEGRLLAASQFERFELVRELPAGLFEPPSSSIESPPPAALPFPPLRPRYVPPGYQEVRRAALRRGPFEGVHLRYTDGLGTISLFEFRSGGSSNGFSQRRHRGRNGGHRKPHGLNRRIGELECRVMGDIAGAELRKMLDSLPAP